MLKAAQLARHITMPGVEERKRIHAMTMYEEEKLMTR